MTFSCELRSIWYVHYQCSPSDGSAVHVAEFISAFRACCETHGVNFRVVAPPPRIHVNQKQKWLKRTKAAIGRFYLREFLVLWRQWRQSRREGAILDRDPPDMVITRYDAETLSIHWACVRRCIPVVTEFNGIDRSELAGTYLKVKQLPWLNRLFSNCHAFELSAGATAVTGSIAARLQECNPKCKPVTINHNGVDVSRFHPNVDGKTLRERWGWSSDTVVICYSGSFIVWHRPKRLLQAFSNLLSRGHDIALLLIGRQEPSIVAMIAALPDHVRSRIVYTGLIPHREMPEYLAAMDIAVLPHTQPYCSPLKLFEYMAMGKATLAPNTEGVREVLKHGVEGVLFDPEQDKAFSDALERLILDAELRERLGRAARNRVEREFTWRANAERVWSTVEAAWLWHKAHHPQRNS